MQTAIFMVFAVSYQLPVASRIVQSSFQILTTEDWKLETEDWTPRQPSNFLNNNAPFVPPKPNEFERA
jgi:hypothetical protein